MNIYTTPKGGNGNLELKLSNINSRKLSGCIPSHIKGFRRPTFSEKGEMTFVCNPKRNKQACSNSREEEYEEKESEFLDHYLKKLDSVERERSKKNEMLFPYISTDSTAMITENEFNTRIANLKGPVDSKIMILVWNYVIEYERRKYINMVDDIITMCKLLAEFYNVPSNYESSIKQHVRNKMMKALMKKEEFDYKNIKDFARDDDGICARWEFQRYVQLKR
ncbi:hypothetical protein MKS88_002146 [Plasmodium brasilianum]|nr:hypothetical protein MKS88_002146 [Plasmodium brasilianum]